MEISYSEIEKIYSSLTKIVKIKFPIKIAVKLSRLLNEVEKEFRIYFEQKIRLANEYGARDENNNLILQKVKIQEKEQEMVAINENFKTIYNNEWKELIDIKFYIDFSPILIDDLVNIEISMDELYGLDKFFI